MRKLTALKFFIILFLFLISLFFTNKGIARASDNNLVYNCYVTGPEDCIGTFTATNYNYNPTTKILKFDSNNFTPNNSSYFSYGYRVIGIFDVTQGQLNGFAHDTYSNFSTCTNSGCQGAYLNNTEGVSNILLTDEIEIFIEYQTSPNPTVYTSQRLKYSQLLNDINDLPVPQFFQTSAPWNNEIYDYALDWSPNNPYIKTWGCALTSAAMIFNYYGMNKLPDGKILDPGTLNEWLINQKDGYMNNGKINWYALQRLSKILKPKLKDNTFDALQFKKINGYNPNELTYDLTKWFPQILEEDGHFIVAKGINKNTFDINDPYYQDRITLQDNYNNTFKSIRRFIPSNTDLSYIVLTGNTNLTFNLINNNNSVGQDSLDDPLVNDENQEKAGEPLRIYDYSEPSAGKYEIEITSDKTSVYTFNIYLYDINGNFRIISPKGVVQSGTTDTYTINFDKYDLSKITINKNTSIEKISFDLNYLYNLSKINNKGILNSLMMKLKNNTINPFYNELNAQKQIHIDDDSYQILLWDINQESLG